MNTTTQESCVFVLGAKGKGGSLGLVPIDLTPYPVGTVVSYGDMKNPRSKGVIINAEPGTFGQDCIKIKSLHKTRVSRSAVAGPGGWQLEPDKPWTAEKVEELKGRYFQAEKKRQEEKESMTNNR